MKTILACAILAAAAALATAQAPVSGQPAGGRTSSSGQMDAGSPSTGVMSDAVLTTLIKTLNDNEIKEAKLAQKRARSKSVKAFARAMLREHGRSNEEVAAVSKRLGLQPSPDQDVAVMQQQAEHDTAALESESGSDFDRAYIDQAVKDHLAAVQKLDGAMEGDMKRDEQLSRLLDDARKTVSRHLDMAQKLQGELNAGAPNRMQEEP